MGYGDLFAFERVHFARCFRRKFKDAVWLFSNPDIIMCTLLFLHVNLMYKHPHRTSGHQT